MNDPSKWVEKESRWDTDEHYRQRSQNGFSFADWINFDSYIAWVIANAVQKMKDEGNTSFVYDGEPPENWEELTKAEYQVMIDGFGGYVKMRDEIMDSEEWAKVKRNLDDALALFSKRFTSLWD